ncbi:glycosyltransferase [bacterium]|nr:glycosyltransferase [bacterium]MDB4657342.1 glycosyltransferase [Verrucomicrobiales bacterium]MDC0259046.1 glycosyltransferase [Verrucomicrobiales bacterium]MDC0276020.1 glycosyltransferase [Verrucomicrobiales bacterium]MDC0322063.1 glycosyltransferase [Verrucomicrobiales bacterium]
MTKEKSDGNDSERPRNHSILSVGKFYYPRSGGIEIVTQEIAEEIHRCGYKSVVACFDTNEDSDEVINRVQVTRFKARMAGPAPLSLRFLWAFRKLARRTSLVILHYPNPIAELALLFLRRSPERKIIVFYHSDLMKFGFIVERLYWAFSRFVMRRADVIITTSEAYPKGSPVLKGMLEKIRVVPLATDIERFHVEKNLADSPEIPFERCVLFVGRFARFKGLDVLIKSLTHLPSEYGVVLIGSGEYGDLAAKLRDELGLADRVFMPGEIANQELPRWYRACDVFVLPSTLRSESFGIVSLEAMACGMPIVTTELGTGTSLYNRDGVTGRVVPPFEPEALAAGIQDCYENRVAFGSAARAEVERHYSLPAFRKNVRELLDSFAKLS